MNHLESNTCYSLFSCCPPGHAFKWPDLKWQNFVFPITALNYPSKGNGEGNIHGITRGAREEKSFLTFKMVRSLHKLLEWIRWHHFNMSHRKFSMVLMSWFWIFVQNIFYGQHRRCLRHQTSLLIKSVWTLWNNEASEASLWLVLLFLCSSHVICLLLHLWQA